MIAQVRRELLDRESVDTGTTMVRLHTSERPSHIAGAENQLEQLGVRWTLGAASRRNQFGPFLLGHRGFTPTLRVKGQLQLDLYRGEEEGQQQRLRAEIRCSGATP